jgi:nucleotide-binding universal stress UspA family protein
MFKKILVCLDGSKLAEQVLPYATDVALGCGSKMVLLQVVASGVSISPGVSVQTPLSLEQDAKDYLAGVASSLMMGGLSVEWTAVEGKPGEAIIKYANETGVDLIAIATHGRSGLRQVVFGSVAQHVVRESGLPILLTRPKTA